MTYARQWKRIRSNVVFTNDRLTVLIEDVRTADGTLTAFTIAEFPSGSTVVAVDDLRMVYLVRQYRHARGHMSVEAIGGASAAHETYLESAQREAHEEAGILAAIWISLGQTEPMTSNVRSTSALWLATGLTFTAPAKSDPAEQIEVVKTPLTVAVEWALTGHISHAPSCVALLRAQAMIGPHTP